MFLFWSSPRRHYSIQDANLGRTNTNCLADKYYPKPGSKGVLTLLRVVVLCYLLLASHVHGHSTEPTLPPHESLKRYDAVVCLDLGTVNSGAAYFYTKDDSSSYYSVFADRSEVHKIPNIVLVLMGDTPRAVLFGEIAASQFEQKRNDNPRMALFRTYKMELMDGSSINMLRKRPMINSTCGQYQMDVVDLFALWMRYFHDEMKASRHSVEEQPLRKLWVITVPAIWNEGAKQIMIEAALKAELTTNREDILICLEPIAGLLWSLGKKEGFTRLPSDLVNQVTLLVDCGGGTCNFALMRISSTTSLENLIPPTSGAYGSTRIDSQFWKLLCEVFGESSLNEWKEKYPADLENLMTEFQRQKEFFELNVNAGSTWLVLPITLMHALTTPTCDTADACSADGRCTPNASTPKSRKCKCRLSDLSAKDPSCLASGSHSVPVEGIRWDAQKYKLILPYVTIAALFETVVTPIIEKMRELLNLRDGHSITHIKVVGGFGQSKYLIERMKLEFPKYALTLDSRAAISVLNGGLHYAKWRQIEQNTILSRSWGVSFAKLWSDLTPGQQRTLTQFKKTVNNNDYASGMFHEMFRLGKSYAVGHNVSYSFSPLDCTSSDVKISLFACTQASVDHTSNPSCQAYGSFNLPLFSTADAKGPRIHISVAHLENTFKIAASTRRSYHELSVDYLS